MEDHDEPAPRPVMNFGPGMKIWLLFALFFACTVILQFLSQAPSLRWLNAGPEDGYPVFYARIAASISEIFMFAVPAIVFANIFPVERFGWFRLGKKVNPVYVLFGILAMVCAILGFGQIMQWCYDAISNPDLKALQDSSESTTNWFLKMPSTNDLFFCLFANAFMPALCEELFFRAGLQQLFTDWLKKPQMSIFITAIIFSAIHFNPAAFPVIFLAGLMLGFAFQWTGSLRINILMHFVFNSFTIVEAFFGQRYSKFATWDPPVFLSMIGLVLSGGFMFLLWKRTRAISA